MEITRKVKNNPKRFLGLGLGQKSEVWAKNWAKFSAHSRASFAVQNDPQILSPNSSQFISPCLVAEILKFHLRELLGFGGPQGRGSDLGPCEVKRKHARNTLWVFPTI